MGTLRDIISRRFSTSKSLFEYELYKYGDIQQKCIIHQGHLQYLYHTTILGDSLFRTYLVVLTRIAIETMEDIIGLYLFSDEKKSASYFFSIDQKTKVSDQCFRNIRPTPKCFLMELKFIEKDKPEIFGAKNNSERQIWVEILKNVMTKSKLPIPDSDSSYLLPEPLDKPLDFSTSVIDSELFYPEFRFGNSCQISVKSDVHNDTQQNPTWSDADVSPYSLVEPTDYCRSSANKDNDNSPSPFDLSSKDESSLSQENTFTWNDIFYSNENDDYKIVLAKTGEYGAFLVRPHSKKTSSSDHDYTLCVNYELNNIRCFSIHQLPKRRNEYSLTTRDPISFIDMIQLCQYYTTNPLPILKKNFSLKKPYKAYENNFYYIA